MFVLQPEVKTRSCYTATPDSRAFCQRAVNGNGCSANQTDIAGRAAGVNSVIAFRAAVDVVCDPHAPLTVMVPYTHTPPEPKLEGGVIAGNAAAVHGEAAGVFYPYAAAVMFWFPVMLPPYMVKLPTALTPQPIASLLPWVILPLPLQSVRMKLTPLPTAIVLVPAAPVMV